MQARMLAYRLMVLSPILYIGSLAVRAHMQMNVFDFTACTKKQHEAITEYRPYVIQAAPFRVLNPRSLSRPYLRKVASNWIAASEKGELKPLVPVHVHDFVREGVKQEIYRAADVMVMHLMAVAKIEHKAGNADQAAKDLVLSIRLAEVMKYSDPYAVAHSGMQQRSALTYLDELMPELTPEGVRSSRFSLVQFRDSQKPLDHLVRWMKQLHNAERVKQGHQVLPIEEVDTFLEAHRLGPEEGLATLTDVSRAAWASNGEVPTLLGELRMAGNSQKSLIKRIDEQIQKLVLEDPEDSGFALVSP